MVLKLVRLENNGLVSAPGEAGGQFLAANIDKKGFAKLSIDQEYQKERAEYYLRSKLDPEKERGNAESRAFWYLVDHVKPKICNDRGEVYFTVSGVKQT